MSSSTGIRRIRDTDSRTADSILAEEKAQVESEKIFAETNVIAGNNGIGIANQGTAAGNYLSKNGDTRGGPMGNEFSISEIIDDEISVSLGSGNFVPFIIINPEGGVADDLSSIFTGESPLLNQELYLQNGNVSADITLKDLAGIGVDIVTPDGGDLILSPGEIVKLIFNLVVGGAWIVNWISSGGSGDASLWSTFPALQSVNMANNDLLMGTGKITFGIGEEILIESGDMKFFVTSGNEFQWKNGATVEMALTFGTLNLKLKDLINVQDITMTGGFIKNSEIATPSIPSANEGLMYLKDVAGITTPFFLDSVGNDRSMLEGTSFIGFTADAELDMNVENIKAGGAGEGMTNIGHLDFIDNLATPVAAVSLYSDGTDLIANTGGGVVNFSDIGGGIFLDSTFRIQGSGDQTKQLAFEVDTFTTGTTRTFSWPNANGEVFVTPAQNDLDLNSFDIFQIDQLTFLSTIGTFFCLNVGFGALGGGGVRANVLNNGDFEITEENVLHFSFDGGLNSINVIDSLFNVSETSGNTSFSIAKFNGLTDINEPTQINFQIAVTDLVSLTSTGFTFLNGADIRNLEAVGFVNNGNIISSDVNGLILDVPPGDDITFRDGVTAGNIFATLNIDGLFLNQLFIQFTSIASPGPTGSANVGELFMDSGNSDHLSIIRNGGVIDLEAGGGASPLTTKGDLFTFDTADARLPVGGDGQVLTADSAEATGLKWATGGGSEFADNLFRITGSVDATKKAAFEVDGFTTATTRTFTLPDADTILGGLSVVSQSWTGTNIFLGQVEILDTNFFIEDGVDLTKQLKFELVGATTTSLMTIASNHTTDRTLTLPDFTGTLAGLTIATQQWTGTNDFFGITLLKDGVSFKLRNGTDITKIVQWDLSAITTGTTRTITMPDADVTLGAGGATVLNDLIDVTIATPQNDQTLLYDTVAGVWKNQDQEGLDDLSFKVVNPQSGQFGSSEVWYSARVNSTRRINESGSSDDFFANISPGIDTVFWIPVIMPKKFTFTALAVHAVVATGATQLSIGFYESDPDTLEPTDLIVASNNFTLVGGDNVRTTGNISRNAGLYYFAYKQETNPAPGVLKIRAIEPDAIGHILGFENGESGFTLGSTSVIGFTGDFTSTGLPSSFAASSNEAKITTETFSLFVNGPPQVFVRITSWGL